MKQFLRVTEWLPTNDDSNPTAMTIIVAIDDLNVTPGEYEQTMRAAQPEIFAVYDLFPHQGPLKAAVKDYKRGFERRKQIERNQAVAYYWNANVLAMTREMLVNPGPTPLDVDETSYVLTWLAKHSNYQGQTVRCYVWERDPHNVTLVELADGNLLPPRQVEIGEL